MKIKNIASLCKNRIMLLDIKDEEGNFLKQWVGDGTGMYPINGLPYMNKEEIFTLFELSEKKQEEIVFSHDEYVNPVFNNQFQKEQIIQGEKTLLQLGASLIKPVISNGSIHFYDTKYLSPVNNLDIMEIYIRKHDLQNYFAVKSGFLLYAIIMPHKNIAANYAKSLIDIADLIKLKINSEEAQQTI